MKKFGLSSHQAGGLRTPFVCSSVRSQGNMFDQLPSSSKLEGDV